MLNHTARAQDEAVEASGGGLNPSEGWYGLALLVVVILATFHPILWNDFVTWDDGLLITENPLVQELSFHTVRKAFTTYDPEIYIPLTFLSYQIDHLLWGLNPVGFHLTNLILHSLNAILVFWLMTLLLGSFQLSLRPPVQGPRTPQGLERRAQGREAAFSFQENPNNLITDHSITAQQKNAIAALVVTALWALHPLNTEAVAWAAARKDLLSGFFFLLSLCTYLKCQEVKEIRVDPSRRSQQCHGEGPPLRMTRYWYWSSITTFLLGLLAKVSIAPLPFILILLEWYFHPLPLPAGRSLGKGWKGEGQPAGRQAGVRVLKRISPYFLLSIVFGIVALGGKHGNTGLLWEKALIGAKATIFYLGKIVWPTDFSVLSPYTRPITWSNPDLLFPLILVTLLSFSAFLFRKKSPSAAFGWVFFLLMLLPSFTNFAKGHDQLRDVYFASDRYAYLPSIGILLPVSYWLLHKGNPLSHWERIRVRGMSGILVCMLSLLSFLSYKQSTIWRNTETLFQNVLRHYPDSHIAWNNLGSIALGRGDTRAALADYSRSLTIRPNAAAFFNLGQIALQEGLPAKAIELYRRAILSRPNDRDAHINLGVLLLRDGKSTEAAAVFQQAIAIDDTFASAHFNLGLALSALGDRDGARQAYTRALELDPSDQEAREKIARLGS